MIRKCVKLTRCVVILPFTGTYAQSVESLDEMENCGAGGWDLGTEMTDCAVDGTVRRTVPVICSLSKEDCRRSASCHMRVRLAAGINFVLRLSEWYDFKFSVVTRVVIFSSCFFSPFLKEWMIRPSVLFPHWTIREMDIKFYQSVRAGISVQTYISNCAVLPYSVGNFLCSWTSVDFFFFFFYHFIASLLTDVEVVVG